MSTDQGRDDLLRQMTEVIQRTGDALSHNASADQLARAVLALVEPMLAAKDAELDRLRGHLPSDAILDLIERSSLGAEDVKAARSLVSRDAAHAMVRWSEEMGRAERTEAAVERVRALHRTNGFPNEACLHDGCPWPCPTARALTGDTPPDQDGP